MKYDKEMLKKQMDEKMMRLFGCTSQEASPQQIYKSTAYVVRDILMKKRADFENEVKKQGAKRVYYMSMEFLVGTSLKNHLHHLGIREEMDEAIRLCGVEPETVYGMEPDAGLGNGGLGRLASCYMDALTTLEMPATGFSIRYEFGIFKQKIVDGWQMEFPDNWLDKGDVWLVPREDEAYEVKFDGYVEEHWENGQNRIEHKDYYTVLAVPYDMMISGADSEAVNSLVLWSAKSPNRLDMDLFSRGEYVRSMEQNAMAEAISKVLYPADDHYKGKALRLSQQYLLVCASLQSILRKFFKEYDDIHLLPQKVAIHINDTHPALCVPELMRILLDEHGLNWETAWEITQKTLAYTNHTVMSEALERWPESLFREKLPRIYQIVQEIHRRFHQLLVQNYGSDHAKINYMDIIADGQVKMANLCLSCCHKVNGVSKLHSDILKNDVFHDFYYIMPDKFDNVTNGIAYRRWLCQANPELCALIKELIGDGFLKDACQLEKLLSYRNDSQVLERLSAIKRNNKVNLAQYIKEHNGIIVDPDSIFDVQVKRLHEYKRQLLNVLHIMHLYQKILENPSMEIKPRTFIFGAKASAGYVMAKQIIRLIHMVAKEVNSNPLTRDKLKVIFLEDYRVSLAELIIPAAEISEQISVAGKEASGTGNMKLMINGAVTLGTLDGANVEILEQVGKENIFLFGLTADEVVGLWKKGYQPMEYVRKSPELSAVLDWLSSGVGGVNFTDIKNSLTQGSYGSADSFMTLADFESYKNAHETVLKAYGDKEKFMKMSLTNIAKAGIFSSDRAVMEYAERIWELKPVHKG
ncbi:MAG: glycogen/starch/alpha-glucan phosphorylase [Clostridia bacterium]|nr:glycogen/starch/alpha-glucan phosphorylase [Clostridia bacterium]